MVIWNRFDGSRSWVLHCSLVDFLTRGSNEHSRQQTSRVRCGVAFLWDEWDHNLVFTLEMLPCLSSLYYDGKNCLQMPGFDSEGSIWSRDRRLCRESVVIQSRPKDTTGPIKSWISACTKVNYCNRTDRNREQVSRRKIKFSPDGFYDLAFRASLSEHWPLNSLAICVRLVLNRSGGCLVIPTDALSILFHFFVACLRHSR